MSTPAWDDARFADDVADQDDELRGLITPSPITDGSRVLGHDGYDVQDFRHACTAYTKLGALVEQCRQRLITAPALIADLYLSFYKRAPEVAPVVPLTPAHQINQQIIAQIMQTIEWQELRRAGTVGDLLNSALATIGAASKAVAALDQGTLDQVNHLHALESGTADLFDRAAALTELADQASGDRATDLYAQAAAARQAVERDRAAAEQLTAELAAAGEDIEDVTRRAARRGMLNAHAEIDAANAAVATFGSTAGGAEAPDQLTTKDKIALAQRIGTSRKLQQVAAICGRITRIALQTQATKVHHPPDEITSITIGNELGRILPSEIALLTDSTLEDLFYLKFAESRLMQYDLIGNEHQGQGPIILALDSSGSMAEPMDGITKEVWSKAVMLALVAVARLQGRDITVLHFSGPGQLAEYTFPKGRGSHMDVISCTERFMNGGTVFEGWMRAALTQVDDARYDKADVMCISDGMPNTIDAQMWDEWQQRRASQGMRAYGVLIGTHEGAGTLARITDALVLLNNLQDDLPALETLFSV